MQRYKINAIVDILLFMVFIMCAYSGFVLHFLSTRSAAISSVDSNRSVFHIICMGLSRHNWTTMHIWAGWAFSALIILHLALHFSWIRRIPRFFAKSNKD